MKGFVTAVVVAMVAGAMAFKKPDFNDPEIIAARDTCAKETGVDLAAFDKMKEEKKIDMKVMGDPKTKCFFKCMMTKAGLMGDDGEPNFDKVKQKFEITDDSEIMKSMKECMEKNKQEDVCEKVFQRNKCMMEKMKMNM